MKKRKIAIKTQILSPENYIRQKSRNLPVGKCFVTEDWNEQQIAQLIITREHVTGNVTACLYLVDLGCLGVKDTTYKFNIPFDELKEHMEFTENQGVHLVEIPYELAHNIIHAAIEYAGEYGFKPHKDFTSTTAYFLEEDTDAIPLMEITCGGKDGKPLYVNTGFDSPARAKQILAQLNKTAGEGNFQFMLPGDDDEDDLEDGDEYDEETDEIYREMLQLDAEEQKNLFLDLMKNSELEAFPDSEAKRLIILTNCLIYNMVDEAEITERLDNFEEKFNHEVVGEEELPNSLFTAIENTDGEFVADLFCSALERITEGDKPKKALEEFRAETGDVPVADFLELLYLQNKSHKKYLKRLAEAAQKHPHYFLIQVYYILTLSNDENVTVKEQLETLFMNENQPFTEFETNSFFSIYALLMTTAETLDIASVVAFEDYIKNHNSVAEETFARIRAFGQIVKMKMLFAHFEQAEEDNKHIPLK